MTLNAFLVRISIDVDALARFLAHPDVELAKAGVPDADRLLLHMGNPALLQAALAPAPERAA